MQTQHTRARVLRLTGAAAALLCISLAPAPAQGFGGFQMSPQINEMLLKARQSRAFADPGISNTSNLLTRPDVRNELVLNGRQTDALGDLQNGYGMAIGQGMVATFQKIRADAGGANPQDMTPEDRQTLMQQMRDKVQDTLFAVQADQDKKAEATLTPGQMKRLHELDLQWRGPLALNDAAVGAKFNLSMEQRAKLTALLKEYRSQQQQARGMMGGFGGAGRPGGANSANPNGANAPKPNANGAGGANPDPNSQGQGQANAPAPPAGGFGRFTIPSPEEMQTQMDEAAKQTLKLRKTMDEKTLALLTPEQQQQWKTVQGRPFTFRTNL